MSTIQDRPSTLPWPPMITVAAAALAVLLHWLAPLPWLPDPLGEFLFAVGWLVVTGAVAIELAAARTLRRAGTSVMAHRGADHLVTGGPYSFTRNPIYLGNAMLLVGIGLVAGIVWFLLIAPLAALATNKLAIAREEKHLEARFGKKYRDYAKKVRRWI